MALVKIFILIAIIILVFVALYFILRIKNHKLIQNTENYFIKLNNNKKIKELKSKQIEIELDGEKALNEIEKMDSNDDIEDITKLLYNDKEQKDV